MYRPYNNRQHQGNYAPYPEHEIYQAQRRLYSLFQSSSSARVQRLIQENHQFTRPFSPYDRCESQALPVLLPSCSDIYPEPSTDRNSVTATLSKEEDGQVFTYPELESNNYAMSGNEHPAKDDLPDPRNDSGIGSTSDTPTLSRAPESIPLVSKGTIYISDDEKSFADDNGIDDPDMLHFECKEEENSSPGSESSDNTDSAEATNETLDMTMKSIKNQRRFFKCDYCDFKAPNRGKMMNHLGITGHSHAAEIMGSFENETFHCKSIIEPVAVHLFTRKKSMKNLTDLIIMCPKCFSHFSTIYQCSIHALEKHGENVYGVGEVVGKHAISLPFGLRCLCGQQFKKESQIGNHLNTCKNYQINSEPNISYFYVCPFCIQLFSHIIGFNGHVQSETKKHNHHGNVQITIIHVRRPTASRAMLPYACGPTLQDTSETRVIYSQDKKKAMKAWRKNKSTTLGAYHQMNHNKRLKKN